MIPSRADATPGIPRRPGSARLLLIGLLASPSAHLAGQESRVVQSDGPPAWGTVALVEEMRLGSLDGDGPDAFGSLAAVAATPAGTTWVIDRYAHRLLHFSREGDLLSSSGREGDGPREFRSPAAVRVLADGSVVVWDPSLRRVSSFDESGEFQRSFSTTAPGMGGPFEILEVDSEGHIYLVSSGLSRVIENPRLPWRTYWLKLRSDGAVVDSLFREPADQEGTVNPSMTFTALSPRGYLVSGRNDSYEITVARPDDPIRIIREWVPVEYTRDERRETESIEERVAGRAGRSAQRIPRSKPAFKGIFVDADGRLWVSRYVEAERRPPNPSELARLRRVAQDACRFFGTNDCEPNIREWREALVYDLFDEDGVYLAEVAFPNLDTELEAASGRDVWTIERGSFDEPQVVRYAIQSR